MAEDASPATGRLLGTANLQRAIDKFDKAVNTLESMIGRSTTTAQGNAIWSGGARTQGGGAANNGGSPSFAGKPAGSAYDHYVLGGGGRQGGGARNNGGGAAVSFGAAFGALAAAGRNNMADQTTRDYVTRYGLSTSSGGYNATLRGMNGNSAIGNSAADRMGAAMIQSQTLGATVGSDRWNQARTAYGQMGLMNPQMSATQLAQMQAGYSSGASYNGLQMYGIRTLGANGQRASMTAIAGQMAGTLGIGANTRFNKTQIAATFDSNTSGYNQSLAAAVRNGSLSQDQADSQRQYTRNRAIAGMNGMSAADFDRMTAAGAGTNKAAADARRRLDQAGVHVTGSALQSMKTRIGAQENFQDNLTQGFTGGLKAANDALNQFTNALSAATNGPLGGLLGAGQGAAAIASPAIGSAAGTYAAARAASRFAGSRAAVGAGARAAGSAAPEAAALGIGTTAGIAVGSVAGAAAIGYVAYGMNKANAHNTQVFAAQQRHDAASGGLGPQYALGAKTLGPVGWGEAAKSDNGSNPSIQAGSSGGGNAASVINVAKKYLGKPYHWGGSNPKTSFDCSGLMQWAFGQAGIHLPRTAKQQQKVGSDVPKNAVRPGDLVFWGNPAHHVAMVVGDHQILEAPHTGANIRIRKYSDGEITNARRVLGSVGNVGDLTNSQTISNSAGSQAGGGPGGDMGNVGGFALGANEASVLSAVLSGAAGGGGGLGSSGASGGGSAAVAGGSSSAVSGSVGSAPASVSGNVALGKRLATGRGWGGKQWDALYELWQGESGWNNKAQNPNSTAFGIAQFLNGTWGPYGSKTSDPTKQIMYGLSYIKDRYGDPLHADSFKKKHNWYDKGAWRIEGDQNAVVHDGEMVVPKADAETIRSALLRQPASQQKGGKASVVLQFDAGSIVIQTGGSDATSMQAAAKQFVDYVAQDDRLKKVAAG